MTLYENMKITYSGSAVSISLALLLSFDDIAEVISKNPRKVVTENGFYFEE